MLCQKEVRVGDIEENTGNALTAYVDASVAASTRYVYRVVDSAPDSIWSLANVVSIRQGVTLSPSARPHPTSHAINHRPAKQKTRRHQNGNCTPALIAAGTHRNQTSSTNSWSCSSNRANQGIGRPG